MKNNRKSLSILGLIIILIFLLCFEPTRNFLIYEVQKIIDGFNIIFNEN